MVFLSLSLSLSLKLTYDTVDGRNPKQPPEMYEALWKMGDSPHQLVQDFFDMFLSFFCLFAPFFFRYLLFFASLSNRAGSSPPGLCNPPSKTSTWQSSMQHMHVWKMAAWKFLRAGEWRGGTCSSVVWIGRKRCRSRFKSSRSEGWWIWWKA